jgi:pimeloyl-ACP methyl ester carboxylesterase
MKKKIIIGLLALLSIPAIIYFFFPGEIYKYSISSQRSKSGFTEKSIIVDNHTIKYLDGGTGEPIVMVHGFGGNKDNWVPLAKFFTGSYRVISLDMPGFGDSTKNSSDSYDLASQIVRLNRFLELLNLEKVHLVGNSMGGATVAKFTKNYPDKVLSLALFAPGRVTTSKKSEHQMLLEKGENRLLVNSPQDFQKMIEFIFYKVPVIPGSILKYLSDNSIESRNFNEKIYNDNRKEAYSLETDMQKIKSKTLILWGDKDRVLNVSGADILEKGIKDSKKIIMKDCGHMPMVERPEETAGYYIEFLKSIK